jgi:putative transposase
MPLPVIGRDGARSILEQIPEHFTRLVRVWADGGYTGKRVDWVKTTYGWVLEIVKLTFKLNGFEVLPHRWGVERSIAWITRWRRLCRDHEGLPQPSEAFIKLSANYRMLTKLAPRFLS